MTASAKSAERSLRRFFGTQDMTQGNPMRNLLMFSIPLLIGNLAQQLYSTADSIIVGNFVGDNALAAVGASGPVINLLLVLFMAISTGVGIMVSQYFGARDRDALLEGIADGTVDMIATDHAPHSAEEKSGGLAGSLMGVPGLESAFAASFTALVKGGVTDAGHLAELMSLAPSRRFSLPGQAGITR